MVSLPMCFGLVWFGSGFRSACALERKDLGGGGFFLGEMGYDGWGGDGDGVLFASWGVLR